MSSTVYLIDGEKVPTAERKMFVFLQADEKPVTMPADGDDVNGMPDNYGFALGSTLRVLEGSETYIYGADADWHKWDPNNTEETAGD